MRSANPASTEINQKRLITLHQASMSGAQSECTYARGRTLLRVCRGGPKAKHFSSSGNNNDVRCRRPFQEETQKCRSRCASASEWSVSASVCFHSGFLTLPYCCRVEEYTAAKQAPLVIRYSYTGCHILLMHVIRLICARTATYSCSAARRL